MQLKIRVLFPLLSFGHCFLAAGVWGDQVKVGEINTSQKVASLTPRSSSSSPIIPVSVAKDGVLSECPHNGTTEVRCGFLLADCESSCRISNGSYCCGVVNLAVEAGRSLRAQNSWNDFQKVCSRRSRLMPGSSAKQRAVAYDIFTWANHKYDAAKSFFAWTSFFYNHGSSVRRGFDVVKRAYDLHPTFRSLFDVAATAESIYGTLQDVYSEVMVLFNTTVGRYIEFKLNSLLIEREQQPDSEQKKCLVGVFMAETVMDFCLHFIKKAFRRIASSGINRMAEAGLLKLGRFGMKLLCDKIVQWIEEQLLSQRS